MELFLTFLIGLGMCSLVSSPFGSRDKWEKIAKEHGQTGVVIMIFLAILILVLSGLLVGKLVLACIDPVTLF